MINISTKYGKTEVFLGR